MKILNQLNDIFLALGTWEAVSRRTTIPARTIRKYFTGEIQNPTKVTAALVDLVWRSVMRRKSA